jgi:hypothetical protein
MSLPLNHQFLGLSDALLVADNPGERPAHGYNLLLGINMNLCPIAAVLHLVRGITGPPQRKTKVSGEKQRCQVPLLTS